MSPIYSIIFIVLGWLLGLLSPHLIELIQKPYRRVQLRRSLFIEVTELQYRFATLCWMLRQARGEVNKSFLEWYKLAIRGYKSRYAPLSVEQGVVALLELNDDQLRAMFPSKADTFDYPVLKKYTLPFLASQVTSLSIFSPEFQRLALEINAKLALVNAEIDTMWFFYTKTFDSSLSNINREAIYQNMRNSRKNIINISQEICDDIAALVARRK